MFLNHGLARFTEKAYHALESVNFSLPKSFFRWRSWWRERLENNLKRRKVLKVYVKEVSDWFFMIPGGIHKSVQIGHCKVVLN